jgi:Caspase domain/Pentapeptide repeats (8 copies)
MSRDALVVGINTYQSLNPLQAPAGDAEAIAQRLHQDGEFRVWRLPEILQNNHPQVGRTTPVTVPDLKRALVQLFKPQGRQVLDTALFYFSGHGLHDDEGISEGYLATSDVNPAQSSLGLSLRWLRRLLEESPVRQQIIWLDCCHSGALFNVDEANPGEQGKGRDRCFIAASRDYQVAYEEVGGAHSVLTQALLDGLEPTRYPERGIDNLLLTDFVNQALKGAIQSPVCSNFGEPILLTRRWQGTSAKPTASIASEFCPYKGLTYFDCNEEDPKYFYGRTALTDQLLDQVRQNHFLAIVGASGSGKSSVLRAGLLYQLGQGRRIGGSDRWQIRVMVPGEHPLQSLAQLFMADELSAIDRAEQLGKAEGLLNVGADGLRRLVQTSETERFVIVVDQFEEVFTLCQDPAERQQFFQCLLGGLQVAPKLYVIVAMRADFFGKCLEQDYNGLAKEIERHLVTVTPMSREELREAIVQPAKKADLAVQPELVDQMIADVMGAPGSLPLLQYTLTELWKQRTEVGMNLTQYSQLGGISGTLQKRATAVYKSFPEEQRSTVQHIFLSLTQLGEGTEDTRRRVFLTDLVNAKHQESIVNSVIQKLANEKLIVTSEMLAKGEAPKRVAIVDVAHEALIRHWELLRSWLQDRRDRLRQVRKLEAAAIEWRDQGQKPDDLLQGRTLVNAQQFQKLQTERDALNPLVESFIQKSVKQRRLNRWKVSSFLVIPAIVIGLIVESALREEGVKQDKKRLDSSSQQEKRAAVESLVAGCPEKWMGGWVVPFISERIFGNCRSLLQAPLSQSDLSRANLSHADLSHADLYNADLSFANLNFADLTIADIRSAELTGADIHSANLYSAIFYNANLSHANLSHANLNSAYLASTDLTSADIRSARLSSTDLSSTVLLATDFRDAEALTQQQLEGEDQPLLCNVALPQTLKALVNPNRDCDRLPQVLLKRYPDKFKTLESAKAYVDIMRENKWED